MAIPLVYWGYAILFAGGATTLALVDEQEIGKVELPDSIDRLFNRQVEPELEPDNQQPQRPNNTALRAAMVTMIATETRLKRRCDDKEQQDCRYCKPAVDGSAAWDRFDGGPVTKPSPKARGSLYQHYVVPWFQYITEDRDGKLYIQLEEWSWRRNGNWDGLDHKECKLYECKLGYRDFLDENKIGSNGAYTEVNPKKPFLGTLQKAFEDQMRSQHEAIIPEWPYVALHWIFSDEEVMFQFVEMRKEMKLSAIGSKYIPAPFSPSGTQYVSELYASGEEDYGYWEDT